MAANRDSRPLLSVVMPSYAQGRFIETAIRSVLEQRTDVELIVADGGSSDETLHCLVELAAQFPGRLRWTSAPDAGPAAAVNAAVGAARAPLIGWLNSDDLYRPGAIGRALQHFERHPADVMVYGEGEHVDAAGVVLTRYPTRGPDTPIAEFANGCFVCQPTAFFRRDVFEALGGLDTMLKAAFDFDLWLRIFEAYPERIGFVDAVQAATRLHAETITASQRARVALEGVQVVARHLGRAPAHWLRTYFAEAAAGHPFAHGVESLQAACEEVIDRAAEWLERGEAAALRMALAEDRRIALSTASFNASVYSDGWAGEELTLKLRQPAESIAAIELHCRHVAPHGLPLCLSVFKPNEPEHHVVVETNGAFVLAIDVADRRPDARVAYRIVCDVVFVPAEHDGRSADTRRLAFVVESVDFLQHRPSGAGRGG